MEVSSEMDVELLFGFFTRQTCVAQLEPELQGAASFWFFSH
jgi:hypothetical protein